MERGRTVYLIVGLLFICNHEQFVFISSQALVAVDCGAFVCCPAGASVFFNYGAHSGNRDRSADGDGSAHAMVIVCFTSSHFVFLASLGGVSDCLLCPVDRDTDFVYHGELQICQLINTFCVTARHLGQAA